ncbi:MAG: hypothetical protein O6704_02605, partial [Nitrospinae bacterium]|nr:hypothetical protein [Nitrospinota bacterium]
MNYDKLWEVFRYMPFKQLGKKGEWIRVQDLDGDIYWVHRRLTTKSFKCAVIKRDKTNLRRGPGTHYKKFKGIPGEKYFSMKVLDLEDLHRKILFDEGPQDKVQMGACDRCLGGQGMDLPAAGLDQVNGRGEPLIPEQLPRPVFENHVKQQIAVAVHFLFFIRENRVVPEPVQLGGLDQFFRVQPPG